MYIKRLEKEGEDLLLQIPVDILELLELNEGDEIEMDLNEEHQIVIRKKQ